MNRDCSFQQTRLFGQIPNGRVASVNRENSLANFDKILQQFTRSMREEVGRLLKGKDRRDSHCAILTLHFPLYLHLQEHWMMNAAKIKACMML